MGPEPTLRLLQSRHCHAGEADYWLPLALAS